MKNNQNNILATINSIVRPVNPLKSFYLLVFLIFSSTALGGILADYDQDWQLNSIDNRLEHSSGVWLKDTTNHSFQEISFSTTKSVSGRSARVDVNEYHIDGRFKVWIAYEENRYKTLDAPVNSNRMILYLTIPYAGDGEEHTFHIGTYSKDPATANQSSNLGNHWYHYYELRGNSDNHWTKFYMDEHPQHVVSSSIPPDNNPTSNDGFNYFDGLSRIYLEMKYTPFQSNWPGPYTMYIDEVHFYQETREENTYSINNVAISYFSNGGFDIDWSSFSQYHIHTETFEVRYSDFPIETIDDYLNADLVPNSPLNGWGEENIGHHENQFRATFTIPNFNENQRIYFAIRDLNFDNPQTLKRVDYKVINANEDLIFTNGYE